jgi:molecular chaperone DnaK (HSP70)
VWGLDLGTTNSLLARWDSANDKPALLDLPAITRRCARTEVGDASRAVPSALHILDRPSFWARLGPLSRRFLLGRRAVIGREALDRNVLQHRPNFVPTFKRRLGRSPLVTVARAGGRTYSAREAAHLYLRELFARAREVSGERIRDLAVTSPVDAYETYRAEVAAICRRLGVRRTRFLDEPVAAALGYGIGLTEERRALVVDFGAGTLHMALLHLGPGGAAAGTGQVLGKAARDVGGNLVDRWLFEEFCRRLDYDPHAQVPDEGRLWETMMLAEACRMKEAVYFEDRASFEFLPPRNLRRFDEVAGSKPVSLELDRATLTAILERQGLFQALTGCLEDVLGQAEPKGVAESEIDDILMVGGSTLLPGVYSLFEARFGRARVRAWQPFEAVVYGATAFAVGKNTPSDFIVHDYALLTFGLESKKPEYTVVIPRGTSFPTPPNFWKQKLVPTCALGEPERVFKLVICELGSEDSGFLWDAEGRLHRAGASEDGRVIVKLNESNPALGRLDPPHAPSERRPRLEIGFAVNADRWLCATVKDLRTGKSLMSGERVVRLL